MYEYDNSFVYVPLDAAQVFFRLPDAVNDLEVFVDRRRPGRRGQAAPCRCARRPCPASSTGSSANSSLFNAVEIERNVMFLILTLIILVAAFNIISGMIMMVKDKGRDIAILRTMGASRGMILRIFMLSGRQHRRGRHRRRASSSASLFAGNIEAIRQSLQKRARHVELFSAEIYFFTRIPARIEAGEVVAVVIMALALSFLATLYPSWRAARLDPVEGAALRVMSSHVSPAKRIPATPMPDRRCELPDVARRASAQGARSDAAACSSGVDLDAAPGRDRRAGRPVGRRQIDAAAVAGLLERPDGGAVADRRRELRRPVRRARAPCCAAAPSASSTSSTICCRNSRRWRTSMLPQMIAGVPRAAAARARPPSCSTGSGSARA